MKKHKIIVFTVRPVEAADTRYRIVQYFKHLQQKNCEIKFFPLVNYKFFKWSLDNSHNLLRIILYIWFYIKRIFQILIYVPKCDTVWIGRELSPIGPPFLENLLFLFKKKVVLDIDDAIFIPDENVKTFTHKLRDFKKFEKVGKKFSIIVAGNKFIADYFKKFNKNICIIPTVVSIKEYSKIKRKPFKEIRIGWIGTPYYYNDFEIVKDALHKLSEKYNFRLIIIGLNKKLNWQLKKIHYLKWKLHLELKYFSLFDIGIMPLRETEFEQGKCGFKIIQYMAAKIPVIASPVGINREIIVDNENGYLASDSHEWYLKLKKLITDENLRKKFEINGFHTVKEKFSLESFKDKYYEILTK